MFNYRSLDFFNYGSSYLSSKRSFTPTSLFRAGQIGAWFDPSDSTTLFTDAAGTIPVTASGDPVGKILDKSGRGNHATQSTAASRPTYQTDGKIHWLSFDGLDDYLLTPAVLFSGVLTTVIGAKYTDMASERLMLSNDTVGEDNRFGVVSSLRDFFYRGVPLGTAIDVDVASHLNASTVYTAHRITNGDIFGRINGEQIGTVAGQSGDSKWDRIGSGNADFFFKGNIYSIVMVGSQDDKDTLKLEDHIAEKSGTAI